VPIWSLVITGAVFLFCTVVRHGRQCLQVNGPCGSKFFTPFRSRKHTLTKYYIYRIFSKSSNGDRVEQYVYISSHGIKYGAVHHTICREQGRRIRRKPCGKNGGDWCTVFGTQRRRPDTGVASDGSDRTHACVGIGPGHDRHDNHVTSPLWRMSPDPGLWKIEGPFCGPRANAIFCAGRPRPWRHRYTHKFSPGTCS
jgi:hypothetical protein